MRKLITFAVISACIGISVTCDAETSLKNRAQDFLNSRWNSSVKKKVSSSEWKQGTRISERTLYGGITAINMTAGIQSGFVLYAGTSEDSPMVGYSTSDTLDITAIPPAAVEFLSHYKSMSGNKRSSKPMKISPTGQGSPTYPIPTIDPVAPFIKTKWGQMAPFNDKCPLYQGQRSITGCDAVAVSQVLRYYKADNFNDYTLEYADERSLEEVSVNFSRCHFDYDNMLDIYEDGKYSEAQANAVAEMMYFVGAACKMKWSNSSSSGQWPLVALDKYFNINASFLLREELPTGYWMRKIQENLSKGKPILYSGNDLRGGHIFVLDGIDSENYVHVNWGWNGRADGYYDITFCHPDFLEDTEDGYYSKQLMICDIEPRTNGERYQENFIATGSTILSLSSGMTNLSGNVSGVTINSYEKPTFGTRLIARKSGSSPVKDYNFENSSDIPQFPKYVSIRWRITPSILETLEPGEWEFMIQTFDPDTNNEIAVTQIPMRPFFKVENNSITERGYKDYPEGKGNLVDESEYLSITITPVTDVIAKAPFFARLRSKSLLTSPDTKDHDRLVPFLCFTNVETGKVYLTQKQVRLYDLNYPGLNYETFIKIDPPLNPDNNFMMPEGRYRVSVEDDLVFTEPLYIDVAPAVDYPILQYDISGTLMYDGWHYGYDYNKTWKDNVAMRRSLFTKGFATVNNNYNPVDMMLFAREADNPEAEEIMISSFVFDPVGYFSEEITPLPGNLYPLEGKYIFYLRYMTPDGEREIMPAAWDCIDNETGLPATPTPHFISADYNAGLPMIEVGETRLNGNTLSLSVKNIATQPFNGSIYVQIYNTQHGYAKSFPSEPVTLQPQESRQVNVTIDMQPDTPYEAYVRSIAASATRGATDSPTLATKPDGSIARYLLQSSESGIESIDAARKDIRIAVENNAIIITGAPEESVANVYTPDGQLHLSTTSRIIENLLPGCYIIRIDNTTAKLLIR